jgi:periplasmic protein TonB
MTQKRKFTIFHGLAASIAIHAVLAVPVVLHAVAPSPEEPPLLIELQGIAPDSLDVAEVKQSERDEKSAAPRQPTPDTPHPSKEQAPRQTAAADEPPMEVAAVDDALFNPPQPTPTPPSPAIRTPPPTPKATAAPDENNVNGAQEYVPPSRKIAQVEMTEEAYTALLTKKVRENLSYPPEAKRARLKGVTTVSFVILSNGDIQPETLKVFKSSGEAVLDAGALSTIRASAPFPPPPREIEVRIGVANTY